METAFVRDFVRRGRFLGLRRAEEMTLDRAMRSQENAVAQLAPRARGVRIQSLKLHRYLRPPVSSHRR